jgi:hypothetical protein
VTCGGRACHVVRLLMSKYALPVKIALLAELPRSADPEIDEAGSSGHLRRPTECSWAQSLSLGAVRRGRHDAVGSL